MRLADYDRDDWIVCPNCGNDDAGLHTTTGGEHAGEWHFECNDCGAEAWV